MQRAPEGLRQNVRNCAIAGAFLGIVGALILHYRDNFHTVVRGTVYRSAQLSEGRLAEMLRRYQIRTIVNLRGANPDSDWYDDERALASNQGVRHFDIPVDSISPPTLAEFNQLMQILDAPDGVPVLIHCQSGINRTGMISAVCVLALEDDPAALERARAQFRLLYGAIPWTENVRNGQAFLDRYEQWLSAGGMTHSHERFREWALQFGCSDHGS